MGLRLKLDLFNLRDVTLVYGLGLLLLCSPDPYKGALKNWIRHVLYFDTLDKTGIEALLVDEDRC